MTGAALLSLSKTAHSEAAHIRAGRGAQNSASGAAKKMSAIEQIQIRSLTMLGRGVVRGRSFLCETRGATALAWVAPGRGKAVE